MELSWSLSRVQACDVRTSSPHMEYITSPVWNFRCLCDAASSCLSRSAISGHSGTLITRSVYLFREPVQPIRIGSAILALYISCLIDLQQGLDPAKCNLPVKLLADGRRSVPSAPMRGVEVLNSICQCAHSALSSLLHYMAIVHPPKNGKPQIKSASWPRAMKE